MNGLRFFIHNDPDAVRFELAGRLGGVDVETLHQAWQREAFTDPLTPVIVDITYITEADQHGRAMLVVMHRFGARIIAESPESYAIVQPIVTGPFEPAISKPGWFGGLMGFFRNDRHTEATFPPRADLISRISARRQIGFLTILISVLMTGGSMAAFAQTGSDPLGYALATLRPINPAAGSTNPSAAATQSLNPYLGSMPGGKLVEGEIKLTLADAIRCGLNFNLGLIESQQVDAGVKAQRARAFAALLPQITARAQQSFEQVSFSEIGLKLPPQVPLKVSPSRPKSWSDGSQARVCAARSGLRSSNGSRGG